MILYKPQDIVIAQSPSYALGWKAILWLRFFVFIEKPSAFSIDFSAQEFSTNSLYIVPPTHFHFISPSSKCSFWCIDIPLNKLSEEERDLLYSLQFRYQKKISLNNVKNLVHFLESDTNKVEDIVPLLGESIATFLEQARFNMDCFKGHLPLAKNLMALLWSRDEKLEHLAINKIVLELCCSTKTLSRTCKSVFGQNAQNVLQYQLLLASLFMMHHCQDIGAIARELGFADKKSFIKFIKRKANHTPRQIIDLIHGNTIASIV